jgi:hypothetical protein
VRIKDEICQKCGYYLRHDRRCILNYLERRQRTNRLVKRPTSNVAEGCPFILEHTVSVR